MNVFILSCTISFRSFVCGKSVFIFVRGAKNYFTKNLANVIFKKIKLTKFEDDQMKGIISSPDMKYIFNLNLLELS